MHIIRLLAKHVTRRHPVSACVMFLLLHGEEGEHSRKKDAVLRARRAAQRPQRAT